MEAAASAGVPYELVLLDSEMPELSGAEVARRDPRARPRCGPAGS